MKLAFTLIAVTLLVALFAVTALTQVQPNHQQQTQLAQQAQDIWKQCDAFRSQGKFKEAKKGYDAVAPMWDAAGRPRCVDASREMSEVCGALPIDVKKLKDGTYTGSAKGYVADVTLEVVIARGKLTGVRITQQQESRPQTAIDAIPQRIFQGQSPSVDAVSGATITSYAVMCAAERAIQQAAKKP